MKKSVYSTPVVEVTKWSSQDIITTSGLVQNASTIVAEVGDKNLTASLDFGYLK